VIKALGDIIWPGPKGVEEVFNDRYTSKGTLQERIKDQLSDPEETHALGLLSESASERAKTRIDIAKHSTGWFDYSREAREAAAAGMSKDERKTLKDAGDVDIKAISDQLRSDLNSNQAEIAIAYLENNRERAIAAKTREGLDDAKKQGTWGW